MRYDIEKFMEEIDSLDKMLIDKLIEETLKNKLIKAIEDDMALIRSRYCHSCDSIEKVEFADLYFKLSDMMKEVYNIDKLKKSDVTILQLKLEKAYLESNVTI